MSESDYIDAPNKLFIYTVRLVIYAKKRVMMWYAYIKHHKHIISLAHTSSTKKSNCLSPLGETGER